MQTISHRNRQTLKVYYPFCHHSSSLKTRMPSCHGSRKSPLIGNSVRRCNNGDKTGSVSSPVVRICKRYSNPSYPPHRPIHTALHTPISISSSSSRFQGFVVSTHFRQNAQIAILFSISSLFTLFALIHSILSSFPILSARFCFSS